MKLLACCLLPVTVLAAPLRVARIGEFEGKVEVQLHPAETWRPALRNMPLVELAWLRSTPGARVEIELDEGSALRLTGDALGELSDYMRLSTGQRVTVLSVDHGVAYFTGQPAPRDAVILAVPGAEAIVRGGTRVRLEVRDNTSQIAVLEGKVRFSSPGAEMDLPEGQTARVENGAQARFFLNREIVPLESDRWSEDRDRALATSSSAAHLQGLDYGLVDLDANGSWMRAGDLGMVWKPKVNTGWVPYHDGQWLWYDELGYTWIANEPWGWLPFHYGRWIEHGELGWVWSPGKRTIFKPGEVYWIRQANMLAWGPLAPEETWDAHSVPRQYLRANITLARWKQDDRELVPFDPGDKFKAGDAVFVIAPPSPALDSARLDAVRPVLRAGSTRIVPLVPGVTYSPELPSEAASAPPPEPPPGPGGPPGAGAPPPDASPDPMAAPYPVDVYYPAPVYTGIVVVNPPDESYSPPRPGKTGGTATQAQPGLGMPRGESARDHRDPGPLHPPEPAASTSKPQNPAPPGSQNQPQPPPSGSTHGSASNPNPVERPIRTEPVPRPVEPASHPVEPASHAAPPASTPPPAPAAKTADTSAKSSDSSTTSGKH